MKLSSRCLACLVLVAVPRCFAQASTGVIIHNQTGVDLTVRRPCAGSERAILINATSDGSPAHVHRLCTAYPNRSPEADGPVEYLFRQGDSATFQFEGPDQDQASELLFWHAHSEHGLGFRGMILYATVTRPRTSSPEALETVGVLSLPQGPTARTRSMPRNRNIQVISESELILH